MLPKDIDLARKITSEYLHHERFELTPILGKGFVNYVFAVNSVDSHLIVRMSKPEDAWRGETFYAKEAWCLQQAARLGIPSPDVLEIGKFDGCPYMIQSLVPGVNGEDVATQPERIWFKLGEYASRIHSVELDGFGENLADFDRGNALAAWHGFVDYNLNSLTDADPLLQLKVYTPDQRYAILRIFSDLRRRPFRFGLSHNDLALRNTIFDEHENTVYLLDWGSAEAHIEPHYDLCEVLRWHAPQSVAFCAFQQGYGMSDIELACILPEVQMLTLIKAFDLTRWAIDRCPERVEEMAASARAMTGTTLPNFPPKK